MVSEENIGLAEKIIKSRSFGNSTTYANLLRYLVRSTIADEIPKETTIASEIFGKKDFDPSQSTLIRVYVYNLRKKLGSYYENEGAKDKKILRIPKGGYAVENVSRSTKRIETQLVFTKKWLMAMILSILLAAMAINIYSSTTSQNKALVKTSGLWKDLIKSGNPKMLVLGDLFVYSEYDSVIGATRTIRDPNINTIQEFDSYRLQTEISNIEIEPLTYRHLILGSTHWIKKLSEIFFSLDQDYTIRTMSRFNPKELQEYDIMVVGMQKTLGVFRTPYPNSAFEYDDENDAFLYRNSEKEDVIRYQPTGDADTYHTDYGLIAKIPGPNSNTIYQFSGIWDTGATQSLKNFTDTKLLNDLESEMKVKFGEMPRYYEVFLEVNGIDRMELSSRIIHMNRLDKSFDQ